MRILTAEQDRDFSQAYLPLFTLSGHTASAVFDGTQVMEKLRSEDWDLVLLDQELPRIPGKTLLQELRKRHIPVIVLTSERLSSEVLCKETIANAYLPLPFLPQELLSLAERVTEKSRSDEVLRWEDASIRVGSFTLCDKLPVTDGEIEIVRALLSGCEPEGRRAGTYIAALNRKLAMLQCKPRIRYRIDQGYRMVI